MLAQRFAAVQAERNNLYERFEASVYDVAQKTGAGRGSLLSLPSMCLARVVTMQCPQGLCLSAGSCWERVWTVLVGLICVFVVCVVCAGLKSMLLEKRVGVLSEALEMKDTQLGEVLAAAHLNPATLQQVSERPSWAQTSASSNMLAPAGAPGLRACRLGCSVRCWQRIHATLLHAHPHTHVVCCCRSTRSWRRC